MALGRTPATIRDAVTVRRVRIVGLAAAAVGLVLLALYPLLDPGQMQFGQDWPVEGASTPPAPQDPHVSIASGLVGPILLVWGSAAARDGTLAPLTVRSALLAPVLGAAALAAGVGRFVYGTLRATPVRLITDQGGERTYDPSVVEAIEIAHGEDFPIVLAVCAGPFVGVAVARRGRSGAVALLLPLALMASSVVWKAASGRPPNWGLVYPLLLVAAVAVPATLGYFAATGTAVPAGKRPTPGRADGAGR